jgi:hypothetical protein
MFIRVLTRLNFGGFLAQLPPHYPPLAGTSGHRYSGGHPGLLPHHRGRPEVYLSSEAGPAALEPGLGEASACQPR